MEKEQLKKAPNFTLKNTLGENVSLDGYKGNKNVLLLFFPLAFTSTCTKELCSVRDNLKIYESLNVEVIGISVDSFFVLKEYKHAQNLNFQLLSDFNKSTALGYEVLYKDFFGMKGVAKRSTFLIDKEGLIRYSEVLDDANDQPNFNALQDHIIELNLNNFT
tara:strand:- start:2407 stop:2892 length:486 start_codon:yes stop_codon:yes gene_type:complete